MEIKKLNVNRKLIVDDTISFVMTENCSFLCPHCLRGDRRPNTISEEVIDTILSQVVINGEVHLTGGEPLLPTKKVVYLMNKIYALGNKPKEISVVTNGSICPSKFEEFAATLTGRGVSLVLTVSNDYYHVKERLRLNKDEDNILEVIREYQKIMKKRGFKRPIDDYFWMLQDYQSFRDGDGVVAIGKGKNIDGAKFKMREFDLHKEVILKGNHIKGEFQVHTDGIITPLMDISWEERDMYYDKEYNCMDHSLKKILKRKIL